MESLNQYRKDIFSQCGEDGILEFICEKLGISSGWCVEFGAWDGKHLSNTRNLILNHGWSAVMIEGDEQKFQELTTEYKDNEAVHCLCNMVGFAPDDPNRLDALLAQTPIPTEFDILSADVDGNDWYIWDGLKEYSAKVVVIEANSSIPANISKVHPADSGGGASALALVELAKQKGYSLVAHTGNCIFVKNELYDAIGLDDNSLAKLFETRFLDSNIEPTSILGKISKSLRRLLGA